MAWTNQSKNSASYSNQSKSGIPLTFGDLPVGVIGTSTFDDAIAGTTFGAETFDTTVPANLQQVYIDTLWTNQTKN